MRCTLDADARTIAGTVTIEVTNDSAGALDRAYLWLYPNRFASEPAAIDDINYHWVYPDSFSAGAMSLETVVANGAAARVETAPHADAGRDALWAVELSPPVESGASIQLDIEYAVTIPERYGQFGCIDGLCTLSAGFYPMLATLDRSGWDLQAPPMRGAVSVLVDLEQEAEAILFDHVSEGAVHRIEAAAADVPYASLFVADAWHEVTRRVGPLTLRHLSTNPPPPAEDARDKIYPYTQENYARHTLDGVEDAAELLVAIDAPLDERSLVVVEVPMRFELAVAHPSVVTVSDRYFRLWPADRFRKLHRRQMMRAAFAHLFLSRIAAAGTEASRDISVAADMIASYLADLFVIREYNQDEFVDDILQPVSFIPAVDLILYNPQTMFGGALFGGVLDEEKLRDDPRRFMHQRPRGRLYYEKLRDILTGSALRGALTAMINDGTGYRAAAEAAYGASLDWFFRQWSLPYPRMNYRLVEHSSRVDAGVYHHEVTVARDVADGDNTPVEPVEVLVRLDDGSEQRLRWDGRGESHRFSFEAGAAIDTVTLDPAGRLAEERLPGVEAHPKFDNRDPPRTRFVYNSLGVLLDFNNLSNAFLGVDFTLARVRDVHNSARVAAFRTASISAGGSLSYTRSWGQPVHTDRLLNSATTRLSIQRLDSGFFADAGDEDRAATRFSLRGSVGSNDKLFVFEPMWARSAGLSGSITATRRDGTDTGAADWLLTTALGAWTTRTVTPWVGHTFAAELSASAVFGDVETRAQLLGAAGPDLMRGYAQGSLFGKARVMGRFEYRHTFVHDLNWNFGHYTFTRGLGGAAFVDTAALSPCESYDVTSTDGLYASAGYGLRFFYDSFGTLQQMMRIDVSFPLTTRARSCFDTESDPAPQVMVFLGFFPPF